MTDFVPARASADLGLFPEILSSSPFIDKYKEVIQLRKNYLSSLPLTQLRQIYENYYDKDVNSYNKDEIRTTFNLNNFEDFPTDYLIELLSHYPYLFYNDNEKNKIEERNKYFMINILK